MSQKEEFRIGIKSSKDCRNIIYVMFAEDCIIFCGAFKTAACHVRNILDHYCKVSGQLVNIHKSKIQFSIGINNAHKREIEHILEMTSSSSIGTYLGYSNVEKPRRS